MGFKYLKLILVVTALVLSTSVNAAAIALDDWWLQTDNLGGLRQSTVDENVFFAVSSSTTWSKGDVYETLDGYHWASSSEWTPELLTSGQTPEFTYYNQGGWNGYTWEGQFRAIFRFSDSHLNDSYVHAGRRDNQALGSYADVSSFAGVVLIKDVSPVPLPAAVWLFGSGLLGLVGFARRKKA